MGLGERLGGGHGDRGAVGRGLRCQWPPNKIGMDGLPLPWSGRRMTATDHVFDPSCALNDREREVLRLLAAGHTAKTIAAQLGRSETSINERLRTARRKTGVGSSRELARLLEAQKNCDNKIDLTTPTSIGNSLEPPASTGLKRQKGLIAMMIAIPVLAVALMVAGAPTTPQAASAPAADSATARPMPLAGSWSLDVARIPEAERPQRVTMTFRVSPDQKWTTLVEIVAPDGVSRHAESTAALDGVPVPISGNMDFIDTVALRQPAPNTLVMTLGRNGTPLSTRVYTVAKDHKSMTETIVWAGDKIPKLETTYFHRID
jgi:DNA-binding CsgD family transcriptional regulator